MCNFYGTTYAGGTGNYGTVFELTSGGKLTTLYNFCGSPDNCLAAYNPYGLIQGANGNFFGVTFRGGGVFEITPAGKLTVLHTFSLTDGSGLFSPPLQANNGNLYGVAPGGGSGNGGTLYEINQAGRFSVLYNFCSLPNCLDGNLPQASLIQATDGNLYGTTSEGGAINSGTIFKLTMGGRFTKLYDFCSVRGSKFQCLDGYMPFAPLVQGSDGNFYGTTAIGGTKNFGNIFEFTPQGTLTSLYSFCPRGACPDGAEPLFLTQATNGAFYGNTQAGGNTNTCTSSSGPGCGTIFSLALGLGPFIEPTPNLGRAGYTTHILGNDLTGTTSVTFNGVSATFTVVSNTYIKATVPSGATSGIVQVATPSGTLSSNTAFNVLP